MVMLTPLTVQNKQPRVDDPPEVVRYGRFDWYDPASQNNVDDRQWWVIRFTDWLCRINPMLDDALPTCWTTHAWLMMTMDALYERYVSAYKQNQQVSPIDWVDHVATTISQIKQWTDYTNHRGTGTCPAPDEDYSHKRIQRRENEEHHGWKTDHDYMFPNNPLHNQPLVDELMTDPILDNVSDDN
ncbi:hypothetical protein [Alloscardovia criceti]|uniref:hypothetical protein n=1 Tax=Alloscardovia criceti TaxID=356828 RepID=UPI000362CDB4|nr:hypothetical protein [Alloscardovia criceti]